MRQYLLDLYEIQKIDLSIREQEKRQEAIPAQLRQLEVSVEQLKSRLATLSEQRANIAKEAQTLRTVVEAETQKIRKWEARLNEIRNQREYQALSRETEGAKRANREAEEKIGQCYTTRDALDKDIDVLKAKLTEEESRCSAEREKVQSEIQGMRTELEQDLARREALVPRVPKALFRKYDAIRSKRLGVGLSPVVAGCCTGCNMRLPPQLYNILQRGDTIEQCPSCHRLIFWDQLLPNPDKPEGDSAAAVTP